MNGGLSEEDTVRPERCKREWTRNHHVDVIGKEDGEEEEDRKKLKSRMERMVKDSGLLRVRRATFDEQGGREWEKRGQSLP